MQLFVGSLTCSKSIPFKKTSYKLAVLLAGCYILVGCGGITVAGNNPSAAGAQPSLSCTSGTITGAGTDSCSVTLTTAAPSGGMVVNLTSSNAAVSVPASVTVPMQAMRATFTATATAVSTSQTATLTAATSAGSATFGLQLDIEGSTAPMQAPSLSVSSTSVNFGNVTTGQTATQSVTLSSTGTAPAEISALTVTGASFTVNGITAPTTLNPGQTATLTLQFSSVQANAFAGLLTIASNASQGNLVVNMSANSVAPPTPTEAPAVSSVSCNMPSIASTGSDICTVSLTQAAPSGGLAVNLSSSSQAISVPATVTIPAQSVSTGFTVTAAPVSTTQTAMLTASTNAGSASAATFSLQVNPTAPVLSVSSESVNFGSVTTGQAATQSVTLSSSGTAPVVISAISLSGSSFGSSGITVPATLNPGQTATLNLQFTSAQANTFASVLTIASNSSQGTAVINLTAVAVAPAAVSKVSCTSPSLTGPGSDTCTVSLTSAAPAGGLAVTLASSNSAVTLPASVLVAASSTSVSFTAAVASVSSSQTATITANGGGESGTFSLQLTPSTPTLSVNTTAISFGNVQTGQAATQIITLSATGTAPVTISGISVVGSLFSASGITTPAILSPGQTAALTLRFSSPSNVSNFTGVLTITSNSSQGNVVVNMTAASVAALSVAMVSCTSASITGAGSDPCMVSLTGAAPAGGLVIGLASNDTSVTVPGSVTVPANATSASFTATVASVSTAQTATLTASSASASTTFEIQLNAAIPTLVSSATTINFGSVVAGLTATQTITLSSTGTVPVTVTGMSVAGSLFSASGVATPLTLNPGQTTPVTLQFTSPHTNTFTGILTITSNSSQGNVVVNMTAVGLAAPAVSTVSCTNASMSAAGSDACTVNLTAAALSGGLAISLASSDSALTVPASVTVPANATSANFAATAAAVTSSQSATITASGGGTSGTFAVQLLPPGVATLSANAGSISFGNVSLQSFATQSITLTSSGTVPVTINSASVSGTGYTISGLTFPVTLNAGQTATLNVQFDPTMAGAATGQITISSNSAGNGTIAINLSGTGFSYAVALTWQAPTTSSDPVAGYNVYRAQQGSSTYQLLNPSITTQTTFTDSTVQAGLSYDYYVASVDSNGFLSVPSNEISVSIP